MKKTTAYLTVVMLVISFGFMFGVGVFLILNDESNDESQGESQELVPIAAEAAVAYGEAAGAYLSAAARYDDTASLFNDLETLGVLLAARDAARVAGNSYCGADATTVWLAATSVWSAATADYADIADLFGNGAETLAILRATADAAEAAAGIAAAYCDAE